MQIFTLSGWAQPADALAKIAPGATSFDYSDYHDQDSAFGALAPLVAPAAPYAIVAWSLGAQLALMATLRGVIRPAHLTLIAPPLQFVADTRYPDAMGPGTFAQFRENYARDPARTKSRFHALVAKGDARAREVMAGLRHHEAVEEVARWLPWLDALAAHSLLDEALHTLPPTLVVHGQADAIVPHRQSTRFASGAAIQVESWPAVGHAPHVHDAPRLRAAIAKHRAAHGILA